MPDWVSFYFMLISVTVMLNKELINEVIITYIVFNCGRFECSRRVRL